MINMAERNSEELKDYVLCVLCVVCERPLQQKIITLSSESNVLSQLFRGFIALTHFGLTSDSHIN